jgi:hypothetical protein
VNTLSARGLPPLAPGARVASQQSHSLCQVAFFDLDPAARDLSLSAPKGETLLGCQRNQLVCTLTPGRVVSDERSSPVPIAKLSAKDGT